jgi:pimeloyl-ACP methyl ester carboxylesterase
LKENPRFEGVEIPDAGHWVHSEQIEAFNAAVAKFLSKLDAQQ